MSTRIAMALIVTGISVTSPCGAIILQNPSSSPRQDLTTWTSTLMLRTGAGACTATLVGARVILTAAHCLRQEESVSVRTNDSIYQMTCQVHPRYLQDQTVDFGLCRLDRDFPGIPEMINTDSKLIKRGDRVSLAGYGCRVKGGVDGQFGELNVGVALLVETPASDGPKSFAMTLGDALCQGDAGGGAYIEDDQKRRRTLIGVNALSDTQIQSFIAVTSTASFVTWARAWTTEHRVSICGIQDDATCRSSAGEPTSRTLSADEIGALGRAAGPSLILSDRATPNSEGKRELALSARVLRVVGKKGETVSSVVTQVCGVPQSESYFAQLANYNAASGIGRDRNTEFGSEQEMSIPVCAAPASRIRAVQISKDITAWGLWKQLRNEMRTPRWQDYERPSDDRKNLGLKSTYFMDVLAELNPGIDLNKLPENATVYLPVVPLSNPVEASSPAIVNNSESARPVFAVESRSQACSATASGPNYPYDLRALLDVLRRNQVARKGRLPDVIPILIADSGLNGAGGGGVFTESVLMFRGGDGFDDAVKKLIPSPPTVDHGTEVATIALGGPLFAQINAATQLRIHLIILPIYRKWGQNGQEYIGPIDTWDTQIVKTAKDFNAQVVNLSLEIYRPITPIQDDFADPARLYVVAAGNDHSDLGGQQLYPARYGGSGAGRLNLVTTGAVLVNNHGAKQWATFSNRSPDYVDIGAPGCLIPTLSYKADAWVDEQVDGTSFAAPLVSFAAAMIKSEITPMLSASETKRRLLASADLDPKLADEIADGRTLNITKALSVYDDVAELNDRTLLFGNVTFVSGGTRLKEDQTFDVKCDNNVRALNPKDIFKIHPKFRMVNNQSYAKIYFRGGAGELFQNKECALPGDLTVDITERSGKILPRLSLDSVADIVRKYIP